MIILARKPETAREELRLAVRSPWHMYTADSGSDTGRQGGEPELVQELERSFRNTYLRPLRNPQEVMLDKDCLVLRSFRYSIPAMSAVCRAMGLGCSQLIFDLGGVTRPGSTKRPVDLELAMRTFNDVVKLRFASKLKGRQLVMDRQLQQVDGLVGPRYELYHNLELYEHANHWLADGPVPVKFHEALLTGRRLALRYRTTDPVFEVPSNRATNEPFFGGYHLGNSETGDCSVKASVVIIRQWCDNKALAEFAEGGRVKHIRSKQFEQRLYQLLERVQLHANAATIWKKQVLRLMGCGLGLGGCAESHEAGRKHVLRRLEQLGFTARLASQVFDHALAMGSYRADVVAAELLGETELYDRWARRTEYDVFNAITSVAKTLSMELQERLEHLAYRLMLGKHSLAVPTKES